MTKKSDICRLNQTKNRVSMNFSRFNSKKNGEKILCRPGLGPKNKELAGPGPGPGLKNKTLPGPDLDQKIKLYRVRTVTLKN